MTKEQLDKANRIQGEIAFAEDRLKIVNAENPNGFWGEFFRNGLYREDWLKMIGEESSEKIADLERQIRDVVTEALRSRIATLNEKFEAL